MIKNIVSPIDFDLLKKNLLSGLTVALVSIPLSISLAVASGVAPLAGIITAIWAGFVGAAFGGSNYNIIGPTGALSGLIAAYALTHGPETVPFLAVVSGIFIILAYLMRLERYLIFIPASVIHGFTLGVAVIIALNQLNFALGLQGLTKHEKFIENVTESLSHINQASWPTFFLFLLFFAGLLLVRKVLPSIPGIILLAPCGVALGYATTKAFLPFSIETLGDTFGTIQLHLVSLPRLIYSNHSIIPAMVIACIAIIETMLSAKIADSMTRTKHHARKEMRGLGFANIVSGFMGGIPATAALARTALNIKTGATSKLSALISSIAIAAGSCICLPLFSFMPMAVIAAMLVYVACTMIEREHFERLFQYDKKNFFLALIVAAITLYEDPIIGILAGAALALLFLVNKLAYSYYEVTIHEPLAQKAYAQKNNLLIYTFKGKLIYLNGQAHCIQFQSDFADYKKIILDLDIYFIDLDGVDALEEIIDTIQNRHQQVAIVQHAPHIKKMLYSSKKFKELEHAGFTFDSEEQALHFLMSGKESSPYEP